jgi:Reverse transcriptase (RNA-dependent DNA polymerase)
MEVPEGFERFYPRNIVLLLLKTIYGLKQAAFEYWLELLKTVKAMKLQRCNADPCVYFKWTDNGLNLWTSWVDDLLSCAVSSDDLIQSKEILMKHFELDGVGELAEYIGCKVEYERNEGKRVVTQPVLIQSFIDEFELGNEKYPVTPAVPNSILVESTVPLDKKKHYMYRKGVGKLIHLSKYTRPDVLNFR